MRRAPDPDREGEATIHDRHVSKGCRRRRVSRAKHSDGPFWPEGARLAVSISMQFEAGAQPERGAESPFPPLDPKYPDLPVQTWYDYGIKEGIPRLLDLWDSQEHQGDLPHGRPGGGPQPATRERDR